MRAFFFSLSGTACALASVFDFFGSHPIQGALMLIAAGVFSIASELAGHG